MKFEFTWIEPSLVVCRTSGTASADGFAALLKALVSQPEFGPGVGVLADHSKLAVSELSASDIARIADVRAESTRGMAMRTALVVGPRSPVRYGLARMFEAYVGFQGYDSVEVFETFDDGMVWLRSPDSPSPSEFGAEHEEGVVDPAT